MDIPRFVCRLLCVATIMTQSGCTDKAGPSETATTPSLGVMSVAPMPSEPGSGPFQPIEQTAASGLTVGWIPFGARLTSVRLPDGTHVLARLESPEAHQHDPAYLGAMVGRVANRIADGQFSIDGTRYSVPANEGGHVLHGGPEGLSNRVWDSQQDRDTLIFRHSSPDGHQGFPGNLDISVRSTLGERELRIQIVAITDAPTPVNLTQHGYWNPAGLFGRTVDRLRLTSPADRFMPVDERLIPTGETLSVADTPYDFRTTRPIGADPLDINLLVPGEGIREMAHITDGVRTVTLLSDYPGFQLYSGEALAGLGGMDARAGLALEPQYPPNAINQPVDGMDTLLQPGEVYRHTIIYRFDGPGFGDEE